MCTAQIVDFISTYTIFVFFTAFRGWTLFFSLLHLAADWNFTINYEGNRAKYNSQQQQQQQQMYVEKSSETDTEKCKNVILHV